MSLLDALGEVEEYGGDRRQFVILPAFLEDGKKIGYYPMKLDILDTGVTPLKDAVVDPPLVDEAGNALDEQPSAGGSPYVKLGLSVTAGPYEGTGFSYNFYLTPGKGRNIGFVNKCAKAITKQPVNQKVAEQFGFQFPAGETDAEVMQQLFRTQWFLLTPNERLDFMGRWVRLDSWQDATAIAAIDHEEGQTRDDGSTPIYHRVTGWFGMNDQKKGLAWVKKVCFPAQEEIKILSEQVVE